MFPDSTIAAKMCIGRTKALYYTTALSEALTECFTDELKDITQFGLHLDESSKGSKEKLEFYVTYFKDSKRETRFLDSFEVALDAEDVLKAVKSKNLVTIEATVQKKFMGAENLVDKTKQLFARYEGVLDSDKLIFLQFDNCNTMSGKDGGYIGLMRKEYPGIIELDGCIVHHLNTALKKLKTGPLDAEFECIKQLLGYLHSPYPG